MLKRPVFRKAEVLASDRALERYVRWVNIMEVPEVGDLLNGGELVLTNRPQGGLRAQIRLPAEQP